MLPFRLRGFHPVSLVFPVPFCYSHMSRPRSEPRGARTPVWALPVSLAATPGIDVSFSSSGYLDVSVRRVPSIHLWIQCMVAGGFPAGFPHSDICGSSDICSLPQLFAAYHVFRRLSVPRHPPCALFSLTCLSCLLRVQRHASSMHSVAWPGSRFLGVSTFFLSWLVTSVTWMSFSFCFVFIRFSRCSLQLSAAMGLSGLEPPTSRLSGVRSNRLSYKPRVN